MKVCIHQPIMSYDHQQHRSSPPPAYSESAAGGMENEMYIDGTLYVDGVPVSRSDQQGRGRRYQNHENPCEKALSLIRSNFTEDFLLFGMSHVSLLLE